MIFIALTTYGKIENIISQIESIYSNENEYWIHYNKREKFCKFQNLKKHFKKFNNVHVIRKYKVYWGHYSIIKSVVNFQKIFLKSNKKYFLHIDAKTINVLPIEEISKHINDYFSQGYSFMGSFYRNIEKVYELQINCKPDMSPWFFKRVFYYKTLNTNSKFSNLHYLFLMLRKAIFNKQYSTPPPLLFQLIRLLWKKYFCGSNENTTEMRKLFFYENEKFASSKQLSFSIDEKKVPKKLKDFCFFYGHRISPNILLNKKEVNQILSYKEFNSILKFCKNLHASEEWFFDSIWKTINPIKNVEETNCFFYIDKNVLEKDFDINKIVNLDNEKICFIRRVQGKKEIDKIREIQKF